MVLARHSHLTRIQISLDIILALNSSMMATRIFMGYRLLSLHHVTAFSTI